MGVVVVVVVAIAVVAVAVAVIVVVVVRTVLQMLPAPCAGFGLFSWVAM